MVDARERPIPTTYDRAATELAKCRRGLHLARDSLETGLWILRQLNREGDDRTIAELEGVLGDLEQAEAALRSAIP